MKDKPHNADKGVLSQREWDELLRQVESVIAGLAPAAEVADLVDDAACALLARSKRQGPIRNWKSYAARVARNVCKAWFAASCRGPEVVPPELLEIQEDNEAASEAEALPPKVGSHLPRDELRAFSGSLLDRERTVFDLYFRKNLPVRHIARRMNLKPVQIRRSIKHILRHASAFWGNSPGSCTPPTLYRWRRSR